MGERGPMPTPTKVMEARGSKRLKESRASRSGEPRPPLECPNCPGFLRDEAKREWTRQIRLLEQAGLIAQMDRACLAAYCEAWGEFVEVVQQIQEQGRTIRFVVRGEERVQENPLIAIKEAAFVRLVKMADRFGMSPAARARVKVIEKEQSSGQGKARFFDVVG